MRIWQEIVAGVVGYKRQFQYGGQIFNTINLYEVFGVAVHESWVGFTTFKMSN